MNFLYIVVPVVIVLFVFFMMYNSLVSRRNQIENAFGSIDAQLKKRYDLIPNLVASVKQYMTHEADVLTKVTELRSQAISPGVSSEEKVNLNNQLNKSLGGIMVAVESYPELKASDNFQNLQRSLNEVEEQLSASRRTFNATVTEFNNAVEMFPSNIIAGMFNFKRREVFEIPQEERENVNVGKLFS